MASSKFGGQVPRQKPPPVCKKSERVLANPPTPSGPFPPVTLHAFVDTPAPGGTVSLPTHYELFVPFVAPSPDTWQKNQAVAPLKIVNFLMTLDESLQLYEVSQLASDSSGHNSSAFWQFPVSSVEGGIFLPPLTSYFQNNQPAATLTLSL